MSDSSEVYRRGQNNHIALVGEASEDPAKRFYFHLIRNVERQPFMGRSDVKITWLRELAKYAEQYADNLENHI